MSSDSSGKEQDGGADVFETLGSPLCQSYTCVLKLANFVNFLGHTFKPQVIANEGEWVWHSRICCMQCLNFILRVVVWSYGHSGHTSLALFVYNKVQVVANTCNAKYMYVF